jgi:hypothetical protein
MWNLVDSTDITEYTRVVFESSHVKLMSDENDFRCMRAVKDIHEGAVLLVEHCLEGDQIFIKNCVHVDSELFKNLYPRTTNSLNPDDCMKKIQKNAFGSSEEDRYIIGSRISNFNHKTMPNAFHYRITCRFNEHITTTIYCVHAIKNICKGDEITIKYSDYSSDSTHKSFMTETDVGFEDFKERHSSSPISNRIIDQYLQQTKCRQMVLIHELAREGLYFTKGDWVASTRWMKSNGIKDDSEFSVAVQRRINDIGNKIKHLQ